jgi:hypothetical protein
VPEAAPLVEAAPAAEAAPLGAAAAAPALAVVAPLVITGAHWYMWKAFQDKLIALGYVLLEDPLRVCIGGCHSNSTPESPKWRDLDESTPLFRNHPFQQVPGNPFPTTPWLRPGYTEMTPVDAKRATPQTTTRTAPLTPPLPTARTKPDPEDDKQRKKKCEPHLELPKGKKVHWGLYQDAIEFNQLASYPTAIINRRRTTAYERISNQVTKWTKGVDPEKGGKMTRKVLQRGIDLLGADSKCRSVTCIAERRQRVIRPDWTPSGKTTQMDVDHIIELQVGYLLEGSGSLDTFANYELLDSSTNSSVGPTLDSAIQRERNRLKRDCPRDPNQSGFDFWETVPMVFAPPLFEGGGKGPGERWTKADIISGKHLDVYEALRRKRKGGR